MDGFDLPVGHSDSAQANDLLGVYLLYKLNIFMPVIDSGFYSDDDLFIVRKPTTRQLENLLEKLYNFFNSYL